MNLVEQLNKLCTTELNESNDENFKSFGGSLQVSEDWSEEADKHEIGLSSSSRGNIYYQKKADFENRKEVAKEFKTIETELAGLRKEFDEKVIALMKKHGYTLR